MYGRLVGNRRADSGDNRGSDRDPHRSAHESEILDADDRLVPVEAPARIEQGVALAGGSARRL